MSQKFRTTESITVAFDHWQYVIEGRDDVVDVGSPRTGLHRESQCHAVLRYLARFRSQRTISIKAVMLNAVANAMMNAVV